MSKIDVDKLQKDYEERINNRRYRGKDGKNNALFSSKPAKKKKKK